MTTEANGTLVIEDGVIPRRVRRPVDLVRMVGALAGIALALTVATILMRTVSGIDQDVADSAAKLPAIISLALSLISGLGQLVLPASVAFDLISRRRGLLLVEATIAALLAALAISGLGYVARDYGSADLWYALAGTTKLNRTPFQPLLAAVFAYITVARLRGWHARFASAILASTLIANLISGGHTFAAQAITVLLGYAVGLAVRYAFGTPTIRPRGIQIANLLTQHGFPVNVLRAVQSTRHGRRYAAATASGDQLQVVVFDRDLEGSGILPRWWRSLRLRDDDALGGWKMREAIDRSTLISNAANLAGAPVPKLKLVSALGSDACVLASEFISGESFAELKEVSDSDLAAAWDAVMKLHSAGIAHRALAPAHLLLDDNHKVWLLHTASGAVAMSDLQRRIDIANLLVVGALVATPERSLNIARTKLSDQEILLALPALQPFALSDANRTALRGRRELVGKMRESVAGLAAGKPVEEVSIERLSPRRMVTIVAGLIAGYLLIGQLGQVNVVDLFRQANYSWVLWASLFTVITFIAAALTLDGFVNEPIPLWRTFLAQLAASFATLVSPPALGTVAVNGRYLQREGLPPAAAGATVAVSQTIAFFVHIGLLFATAVAAGSAENFTFDIPPAAVISFGALALLAMVLLPLPPIRKFVVRAARPRIEEVVPRLVTAASRPSKLVEAIGGMLILNAAFCFALVACVRAFGGGGTIAAISLVYLAGSTLGQAAPTPGGIGAVETVMTAGLVTAGVDGGIALSSVLLYRVLTFWLPTIPGWFAFRYLTKRGSL